MTLMKTLKMEGQEERALKEISQTLSNKMQTSSQKVKILKITKRTIQILMILKIKKTAHKQIQMESILLKTTQ